MGGKTCRGHQFVFEMVMDKPLQLAPVSIRPTMDHRQDRHTALAQTAALDSASCSEIYEEVVVEQYD